jgi:predicted DNA-binding transcriptional regulator YafY
MVKSPAGGSTPGVTRVVTPRGVMQLRGQIYLSAFCHQSSCDKTFRLDESRRTGA